MDGCYSEGILKGYVKGADNDASRDKKRVRHQARGHYLLYHGGREAHFAERAPQTLITPS